MADGEAILVYSECPHCGVQLPDDHGHSITLEVRLVEARDSAPGWIASGTGSRADGRTGFCPNCGMLCAEIVRRLPAELDRLPCPKCKAAGPYEYSLSWVRAEDSEFAFIASVTCAGCAAKSVFTRVLSALSSVRRIKIGPAGLEVEVGT